MRRSKPVLFLLVSCGLMPFAASVSAQSPETQVLYGCYDAKSGAVYRIKAPGLPTECKKTGKNADVQFQWNVQGPPGEKGATGPKGDPGERGAVGADGPHGPPGLTGLSANTYSFSPRFTTSVNHDLATGADIVSATGENLTQTFSCPAGKSAIGASLDADTQGSTSFYGNTDPLFPVMWSGARLHSKPANGGKWEVTLDPATSIFSYQPDTFFSASLQLSISVTLYCVDTYRP